MEDMDQAIRVSLKGYGSLSTSVMFRLRVNSPALSKPSVFSSTDDCVVQQTCSGRCYWRLWQIRSTPAPSSPIFPWLGYGKTSVEREVNPNMKSGGGIIFIFTRQYQLFLSDGFTTCTIFSYAVN